MYVIRRIFIVLPKRAMRTLFAEEESTSAQIAGTTTDMSHTAMDTCACTRLKIKVERTSHVNTHMAARSSAAGEEDGSKGIQGYGRAR